MHREDFNYREINMKGLKLEWVGEFGEMKEANICGAERIAGTKCHEMK